MIKNLRFKENYILYVAFFALGFGKVALYLPIFLIYFILKGIKLFEMPIHKSYLVLMTLVFIATFPLYTLGGERMTIDSPFQYLLPILFSIIAVGFILQAKHLEMQFKLIYSYILGFGLDALYIVVYSYWTDPLTYGYGLLVNPFNGENINSPGVSNTLSVFSSSLIYSLLKSKPNIKKIAALSLGFTILGGLFLGGRTFFIILLFSIFTMVLLDGKVRYLPRIALYILIILSIAFIGIFNFDFLSDKMNFTFQRLSHGLESNRFSHYAHGIEKLIEYPFGGFEVNTHYEFTHWFHNVFLDNARIGGWFPVISLLFAVVYISKTIFYERNQYFVFGYLMFMVSLLVMQQDVVLEANFRLLIIMFFSGILLHTKNCKPIN